MGRLVGHFLAGVGGSFLVLLIADSLVFARDDSDPAGTARSGMLIRTDNLTGCQYLRAGSGGLTPRVDGAGRHIGCKP